MDVVIFRGPVAGNAPIASPAGLDRGPDCGRWGAGRWHATVLALALAVSLMTCPPLWAQTPAAKQPASASFDAKAALKAARSWGYQLQDLDIGKLAKSTSDVLVIDYPRGDGGGLLAARDIKRLQTKPDGTRRLVIAYMNIGEAEDYRYYWKKAWETAPPAWMGSANCRWKGDHRVRHWDPAWQSIIFGAKGSYLDRVIAAGFDGVYLDRIDIYYFWRNERWQGGAEMVDLVVRLSQWAKARKPGFLIMPQNGEELLVDDRFRAAIDGIGKEDMVMGDYGNDAWNHPERIARAERNFAPALADGLPVFGVEYARKPDNIAEAKKRLEAYGFIPYFGPRSLAYLGFDGKPHKEDGDTEATGVDAGGDGC